MRTSEPAGNRDSPPAAFRVNRVRIDGVRAVDVPDRIEEFLRGGASHVVHFCPAHPTVLARDDPGYRAILNRGDLNLPDGASVVWAIGLLGGRVERVTGTDTFLRLCRAGEPRRWRHYLYGGAPAVVQQLRLRLEDEFPGILIVGAESPPFRPLDDGDLELAADRIRRSGADLVWVGLGTPKQDVVAEQLRARDAAPVFLCVGAAFDFLSGQKQRAPLWMQQAGLEWAHRLAQEPGRLWHRYLIGNIRFVAGVLADRAGSIARSRR